MPFAFPIAFNLASTRDNAPGLRQVFCGDSLFNEPGLATRDQFQLLVGYDLVGTGAFTAFANGYASNSPFVPVLFMTGTTTTNQAIDNGNSFAVAGGAGTFSLPLNAMFEWSWNTGRLCGTNGKCIAFRLESDFLAGGVNENHIARHATRRFKVRVLYYAHSEATTPDRSLKAYDLNHGTAEDLRATWSLKTSARKCWKDDVGDPDAAATTVTYGTINAFYPDVVIENKTGGVTPILTIGDESDTTSFDVGTEDANATDKYVCIAGLVWWEIDENDDFVPGTVSQCLAENSTAISNITGNAEAFKRYLDLTTIDRTQRPHFWTLYDAENVDAATSESRYDALLDLFVTACDEIGLPEPAMTCLGHWKSTNYTAANCENWNGGAYNAAVTQKTAGVDAAFYSWYAKYTGLEPDASSAGDFRTLVTGYGLDNFDYGLVSSGNVADENWMDGVGGDGPHPANATVAAAHALLLTEDITEGTPGMALLAHYKFDAGTAVDSSVNGYDGTVQTGVVPNADPLLLSGGKSMDFPGGSTASQDAITTPVPDSFLGGDFTVSVWINPDDVSTLRNICGTTSLIGANKGFVMSLYANSLLVVDVHNGTAQTQLFKVGSIGVVGTTMMLTATYTLSTGALTFYLNGESIDTGTSAGGFDTAKTFYIGSADVATRRFDGRIDDVRIYTEALTTDQVAALYSAGQNVLLSWNAWRGW